MTPGQSESSRRRARAGGSRSGTAAGSGTAVGTSGPALHLARWTVTSGSNVRSRGAVVIEAGAHHWRSSAEGNGAVDALLKAVDRALADILAGHPRLVGYEVHALAEGPDAEGLVTVSIMPPEAEGTRGTGRFDGRARSTNIIAASIEAYVDALNAMLARPEWRGAAESAGRRRRAPAEPHGRRAKLHRDEPDAVPWFDR